MACKVCVVEKAIQIEADFSALCGLEGNLVKPTYYEEEKNLIHNNLIKIMNEKCAECEECQHEYECIFPNGNFNISESIAVCRFCKKPAKEAHC